MAHETAVNTGRRDTKKLEGVVFSAIAIAKKKEMLRENEM